MIIQDWWASWCALSIIGDSHHLTSQFVPNCQTGIGEPILEVPTGLWRLTSLTHQVRFSKHWIMDSPTVLTDTPTISWPCTSSNSSNARLLA